MLLRVWQFVIQCYVCLNNRILQGGKLVQNYKCHDSQKTRKKKLIRQNTCYCVTITHANWIMIFGLNLTNKQRV